MQWYRFSWKALGPYLEPCFGAEADGITGETIKAALLQGIEALHASNSPISINTYLRCIQAFLNWCHEGGHIKERVKLERLKEQQKILSTFTSEHLRRLVTCKPRTWGDHRILMLILLLLDNGLRIEEALSLRREDVDLDNLLIRVSGKGGKYRLVPMSLEIRKVLFRWLSKTEQSLVFGTRSGTKQRQRNALRDFKALGAKLGIVGVRVSFHTLRHTFAVSYLRAGGNVFYLQRILGHSTLEMTNRYVRSLGIEDLQAVHNKLSVLSKF